MKSTEDPQPLAIRLSSRKTSFHPGEPIELLVSVTNRTSNELLVPTFERNPDYLGMFVLDFEGKPVQFTRPLLPTTAMPAIDYKKIAPYESWQTWVDLQKWHPSSPVTQGPWTIHASWKLDWLAKGGSDNRPYHGNVTSNSVRVDLRGQANGEVPWGQENQGLQCRIFADQAEFQLGDPIVLYAEFRWIKAAGSQDPRNQSIFNLPPHFLSFPMDKNNGEGVSLKASDLKGNPLKYIGPVGHGEGAEIEDIGLQDGEVIQKRLDITAWYDWKSGEPVDLDLTFSGTSYETHWPRYWTGTVTSNRIRIVVGR